MTALQWLSIAFLVVAITLSVWRHINIGTLMLTATLPLILLGHITPANAFKAFPASLVLLIIGVTMLFAHAERSGAVSWLVDQSFRLIGGRAAFVPWIGFVVGAGLSTMGAFPTAPISLLLPIMATMAARHRLSYPLLAVTCVLASNAAGLSPLSPAGATVQTVAAKLGVHYSAWKLYAIVMALHMVIVALLLLVHWLLRSNARWSHFMHMDHLQGADEVVPTATVPSHAAPGAPVEENRAYRIACLLSLVAFVLIVVLLKWDVGLTAIALSFLLQFIFRPAEADILKRVPLNVILLLSGLVIYFGVMDQIGTMDAIEHSLGSITDITVLVLLLAYATGIISNMESSTLATIGVMVPIGLGAIHGSSAGVMPMLVAITMSACVVVMNPVHIAGALIIANCEEQRRDQMFRDLLAMALTMTLIVPGLVALGAIAAGV